MEAFKCQRCGACCKMLGLLLPLLPAKTVMDRFVSVVSRDQAGDPRRCGHLRKGDDGRYGCAIYNEWPDVCRVDKGWEAFGPTLGLTKEQYYEVAAQACEKLRLLVQTGHERMQRES